MYSTSLITRNIDHFVVSKRMHRANRWLDRVLLAFPIVTALLLIMNAPMALAKSSKHQEKPNILMILIDDYGVDKSPLYTEGGIEIAPTPTIESVAEHGIQFTNAWTAPNCMSTRAQIITGQFGFRTGILNAAPLGVEIDTSNPSLLPKLLQEAGYATAKIGKYQLSLGGDNAAATKPIEAGYDYFFGNGAGYPPDRVYEATDAQGSDPDDALGADYFIPVLARFQRCSRGETLNPVPAFDNPCGYLERKPPVDDLALRADPRDDGIQVRTYSTTWDVDEALAWIEEQDGPWFMDLSFQATHAPFVYPPEDLVDDDIVDALKDLNGGVYDEGKLAKATTDPAVDDLEARLVYAAMVSAVDTETGRLLDALLDPETGELENTIVIILGDNGTPSTVVAFDPDADTRQPDQINELRSKSSYYEGGVNVPFVVAGPKFRKPDRKSHRESHALVSVAGPKIKKPGRKSHALVSTTDLFTTVLDWAGVDLYEISPYAPGSIDGVSFARVLDVTNKNFSVRKFDYTEIAHLRVPPTRPTPNNPPATNIFGVYEGSVIRDRRYKLVWATHYDEPRFVSDINLVGAPLCPPPFGNVCTWSCVDGSESCEYLERVKQVEFYDLKKDPFEFDNLLSDGKKGLNKKQQRALIRLERSLERLLDVEVDAR